MKRLLTWMLPCLFWGCGAGETSADRDPQGSRAVVQSGPQDIGEFRAIVARGEIPETGVLDKRGFFAEHKIDLPDADCGASVCVHPMLAVAPRFDGGNWAMAFVGMNTAVDVATLPSAPRHLILVGDIPLPSAASLLAEALGPDDRVSAITLAHGLDVQLRAEPVEALQDLSAPPVGGPPDAPLYGGLAEALELVNDDALKGYATHLLVFGGGTGLGASQQLSPYEDLALAFAKQDVPISVFVRQPDDLSHLLSEATSGNYYFYRDARDQAQALEAEIATAFVPIARNLRLTLEAAEGYSIGNIYGAPRASADATRAVLKSPVAYVGARESSSDVAGGRRGGGGGWFVQLLSDRAPTGHDYEPADAFTLTVEYDDAVTNEAVREQTTLATPLGVGQNPPPQTPFFSDRERGKPFMMLNMYLALSSATMLANDNQCGTALALEPMMTEAWEIFTELFPDPDIDADFALLEALTENIRKNCTEPMTRYIEFPGGCGYI